jgi:hypothetical protein
VSGGSKNGEVPPAMSFTFISKKRSAALACAKPKMTTSPTINVKNFLILMMVSPSLKNDRLDNITGLTVR